MSKRVEVETSYRVVYGRSDTLEKALEDLEVITGQAVDEGWYLQGGVCVVWAFGGFVAAQALRWVPNHR